MPVVKILFLDYQGGLWQSINRKFAIDHREKAEKLKAPHLFILCGEAVKGHMTEVCARRICWSAATVTFTCKEDILHWQDIDTVQDFHLLPWSKQFGFNFFINRAFWADLRKTTPICFTQSLNQGPVFQFLRLRSLHRSASGWVRSSVWAPKSYMDFFDWERWRKIPALCGKNIYNADWAHPTPKRLNWKMQWYTAFL